MGPHRKSAALARRAEIARALDAVRRLVRALRVAGQATHTAGGVTGAQMFLLQQLLDSPAESLNELAARTYTHQSSVSVVVSRLVEAGLILRRPSPSDARRTTIGLTAKGARLARSVQSTVQVRLAEALERMSATERAGLVRGLERWIAEAGLQDGPAELFFEEGTLSEAADA
jgi:DNA-binding MarR family transcriptional regulator